MKENIKELKIRLSSLLDDSYWHQKRMKSIELQIIEIKELLAVLENRDGIN